MLHELIADIHSLVMRIFDQTHKMLMNNVAWEMRTTRILAGYTIWIFLLSLLIVILSHIFSWYPIPWNIKIWKKNKPEEKSLEITPYTSIIKHSTFSNGQLPNFLPDTQDLQVCEDLLPEIEYVEKKPKPKKDYSSTESEALTSLRMALQMKAMGKKEKAMRLFQHAMALHPVQPDILNHYGEFLESQDIVKADHMYTRALSVCPQHSRAIVNRQRTLPLVEELDEKQLISIDTKRDRLIKIPSNDPALKRMKKEAYFQHIYHTVAIEGNTMTLSETRMVVETRMAVPGKSIVEHNEILGLEAALKYLNTSLLGKYGGMLAIEDILQIHRRVLGYVDPILAGTLRGTQVYVGEHTPPPPRQLFSLMKEFVDWMNSEEALKLHPVKHAALAHYKLVYIHPFVDGNGRTARLLMNLILMRAGYPPVIIRKQDRSIYYDYLQLANEGDVRPFTRFIAECTERTLDVYLYATEVGIYNMRALESQEPEPNTNNRIIRSSSLIV